MASRKERLITRWVLCQCREARKIKTWPYSSRSHKLFLISSVTSPPVLAACPHDKHSFLESQFTSHLLWERFLYSQSSWLLPGLSSQHHLGVLLQTVACGPDGSISFSASPASQRVLWEGAFPVLGNRIKSLLAATFQCSSFSCYFPIDSGWKVINYTMNIAAWLTGGWPKCPFWFFYKMLPKNPNEHFGQPNVTLEKLQS